MKTPRVTDHCLVRYLERVKGLDITKIRRHIAELCAPAAGIGCRTVKAEGVLFELDVTCSTVKTVTPVTGHPNATKKREGRGWPTQP